MLKAFHFFVFLHLSLSDSSLMTQNSLYQMGAPSITNFNPQEYKGLGQVFSITQDDFGIIYISDTRNVVQYDGESWRTIQIEGPNTYSNTYFKNEIYFGGYLDFGKLVLSNSGSLIAESFVDLLDYKEFGTILHIIAEGENLIFQSEHYVFVYNGEEIEEFHYPNLNISRVMKVNDKIVLSDYRNGLYEFELNGNIHKIKSTDRYTNLIIHNLQANGSKDLMLVESDFFQELTKEGVKALKPNSVKSKKYLKDIQYYDFQIQNNSFVVTTRNSGVLLLDSNLDLNQYVNTETGLQDNWVHSQFTDRNGDLWLGLNKGISKLSMQSPITHFNKDHNLKDPVEAITRCYNNIYTATQSGVYVMNLKSENTVKKIDELKPSFQKIKGNYFDTQCWDLLNFKIENDELLLAISNNGIHEVYKNGTSKLVIPCEAYRLFQSETDLQRLYVGVSDGLQSYYYNNGKWIKENRIKQITDKIITITEFNNELWLGNNPEGVVYRVSFSSVDTLVKKFTTKDGLPELLISPFIVDSLLVFGTYNGVMKYDSSTNKFIHFEEINNVLSDKRATIWRTAKDYSSNMWLAIKKQDDNGVSTYERGYLKPDKLIGYEWISTPFNEIEDAIHAIYHDEDGISWLGGQNGLYRFDPREMKKSHTPYFTQIRKVVANKDSVLFWGFFKGADGKASLKQSENDILEVDYSLNKLTFHFAAQDYEDNNSKLYSFVLEGLNDGWSDWKRETKSVYTNLHEGTYTFRVKTKNKYGVYSVSEPYVITILPPWYRTWPAYIMYVLLLASLIILVVYFWTSNLRSQVNEKTLEVRKQKDIIEEKNDDIMSSIEYAQKIQQSMLPPQNVLHEAFADSFVLYKPRDVVSGDFYWIAEKGLRYYFALMDCTGHGVPGAFMSMIGNSQLNEVILEKGLKDPAQILDVVRKNIVNALNKNGETRSRDGMDGVLASYYPRTKALHFAGANNALYIIRKTGKLLVNALANKVIEPIKTEGMYSLYELKPNKMPLGYYPELLQDFSSIQIVLNEGDLIYTSTDGYPDQFGGPKGKKFKRAKMLSLWLSICHLPLDEQKKRLESTLAEWMGGNYDQVDDICVMCIKV